MERKSKSIKNRFQNNVLFLSYLQILNNLKICRYVITKHGKKFKLLIKFSFNYFLVFANN